MSKPKKKRKREEIYLEAQKIMKTYVEENWESNYGRLKNIKLFFDCMVNDLNIQDSQPLMLLAEQVLTEVYNDKITSPEAEKILKKMEEKYGGK